jgi:hypothetical protein
MVATSFLGLCLAAPALLMLLEYFPATSRSAGTFSLGAIWVITPSALPGFIIPAITAVWPVFVGSLPHTAVEMVGAFVPLAAIIAAVARKDFIRRHLGELVLLIVLLVAMMLPSPTPLRWSFHWLPLFHLVAAIMGACALENVRRAWLWGIGLVAVALLAAFRTDHGLRTTLVHAAIIVALCLAWAILERRGSRLSYAMPATITIVMIIATFATFSRDAELPTWRYDRSLLDSRPLDPARRYLSMVDLSDIMGIDERERFTRGLNPELRPGNMGMLAGLDFVNGYSPLGPIGLKNIFEIYVHGAMKRERAEHILERESGPNQLLHHMGVDGLIVPRALVTRHVTSLARNGWRPAATLATCLVLHREQRLGEPIFGAARAWKVSTPNEGYAAIFLRRTASLPVVLLRGSGEARYGRRSIGDVEEDRHHTSFRVRGKGPVALVIFRRPWLPGWRATIDGRPLDVIRADMLMPAVEIPADAEGEVRLFYRPRGLVIGVVIAVLALIVTLALGVRRRQSPPL